MCRSIYYLNLLGPHTFTIERMLSVFVYIYITSKAPINSWSFIHGTLGITHIHTQFSIIEEMKKLGGRLRSWSCLIYCGPMSRTIPKVSPSHFNDKQSVFQPVCHLSIELHFKRSQNLCMNLTLFYSYTVCKHIYGLFYLTDLYRLNTDNKCRQMVMINVSMHYLEGYKF